jgi:hypothetical protein
MRATLATAVLLALSSSPLVAGRQPESPPLTRTLVIPRVATPPSLDDYLDGVPRGDEAAVTTFVQRDPGDGIPASQPTEAYLSYDDEHLYAIFVARDREPEKIRATLAKRETISNDDWVALALDTFHDRRRAYLFIVNPHGVQLDGITTEGQNDDYSFDTVWHSEGRLTPFGYVVRMAIPFKSLRFSETATQTWGIALGRAIQRNNESSFWPHLTRRVTGMLHQLGSLEGLRDISPGRNVQFIPYGVFTRARFLEPGAAAYDSDTSGRAGVDGKMILKDAFTVDLTFNPDFSQVESDEPQVTVNQRFEVFFPEKRPFFLENAAFFTTPLNLFFSRRIADPQAGARVTGKQGRWAVAALAIDDREPGRGVAPEGHGAGDRAGIAVARVQREFAQQSSVGFMATSRDFGPSASRVASVDTRLRLNDHLVLSGQAVASHWQPLEGPARSGPAFSLTLDRTGRHVGWFLNYTDVSADFAAPLGFVSRTDYRQVRPFVRYTWFAEQRRVVSVRPELSGLARWDQAGELQDWEINGEFQANFRGQTWLELRHEQIMERFAAVDFRKHETSAAFGTAWVKWIELAAGFSLGREINFFPAQGLAPFLADATESEVQITLRPLPQLRLDGTYLFARLAGVLDNHLARTRANYQFTRELSLRAIVDYASIRPEASAVDLELTRRVAADVLVTYLINPWTAFHVGYTDGYENLAVVAGRPPAFGAPRPPDVVRRTPSALHSTGRQFFVKTSYLLRF